MAASLSDCEAPVTSAQREQGIPDRLLSAIATVESGRRGSRAAGEGQPWPWTVNAEGVGRFYHTKAEAIAAVTLLQARGVRSIDVGCLQVNLMHHPAAFATLEEAFDPRANAAYAARFLLQLRAELGDWGAAVAAYHSRTSELGAHYAQSVTAVWRGTPPRGPRRDSTAAIVAKSEGYTVAFVRERAAAAAEWRAIYARDKTQYARFREDFPTERNRSGGSSARDDNRLERRSASSGTQRALGGGVTARLSARDVALTD